uniref:RIKEN cDNA 4930447F04 gene n=1 Tax=Peromyscus maniculatus bairdii TaxID=230844 RepID=A0A8C8TSW1_PERMB
MTKVNRKSLKQNRAKVTLTPRTKGKKKRKTFIPLRCRLHFKVSKTRMKTKRSIGGTKKKFQTYSVHPKKRKRSVRPTIYVCYHMLSRKWKERKEGKRNKRRCQSKKKSQHKRRYQNKKQKKTIF